MKKKTSGKKCAWAKDNDKNCRGKMGTHPHFCIRHAKAAALALYSDRAIAAFEKENGRL